MIYRVEEHEHGIVVMGSIPVADLCALVPGWEALGWDWCDGMIGEHLGAAMVVTNQERSRAWRDELGLGTGGDGVSVTLEVGTES